MKDNVSSTTFLIVDTISFDRFFMCKLEKLKRINDKKSTLKKTEKKKKN